MAKGIILHLHSTYTYYEYKETNNVLKKLNV